MDAAWDALNARILAYQRCALAKGIQNKVPGQGSHQARVLLIGEAPGAEEDTQGLAFVGAAGQLLTKMLSAINLSREEVFIANTVKCRPPGNRIPLMEETAACLPFLREQTRLLRPQIILLLGATALKVVLGKDKRITRSRGQWVQSKGVHIMPTFHPSALLRDPAKKRPVWEDLKSLQAMLTSLEQSS